MTGSGRQRHRTPADHHHPAPPPSAPAGDREHSHALPRGVVWGLSLLIAGQILVLGLTAAYAWQVNQRLNALEQFVAERGAQRDAERDQLDARIGEVVCAVLDRVTAPELNDVRADYGCGPGTIP